MSPPAIVQRTALVVLLVATLAWSAAILAAPIVATRAPESGPAIAAAAVVYLAGSFVCHQRSDRAFHLSGFAMPVCARCTGLYLAAPIGVLLVLVGRRSTSSPARPGHLRAILMLVAIPTAITVMIDWLGIAHPAGWMRALAALPLGAFGAWLGAAMLSGDLG